VVDLIVVEGLADYLVIVMVLTMMMLMARVAAENTGMDLEIAEVEELH
jgi:hypothetical protein